MIFVTLLALVITDFCDARPAELPSTSLNLPISEAVGQGEKVNAKVWDSEKDSVHVERTFRERPIHNAITKRIIDFTRPEPLIDHIKEEEKYGNRGDQLEGLGTLIVKGTEMGSRFLGNLITLPRSAIQNVSGRVTQSLNGVGARLIGLQ